MRQRGAVVGGRARAGEAGEAEQRRGQDDQRERRAEEIDGDEGGEGKRDFPARVERAAADPQQCFDHDRQDRGLEPEEQAGHDRGRAPGRVDDRQPHDRDQAGEDEQAAGRDPAFDAMLEPADVGRQLLRLGARQEHAEIERVEELRLVDPLALLDQLAMHDRDLARRPAEAQQRDLGPDPQRRAERDFGHAARSIARPPPESSARR